MMSEGFRNVPGVPDGWELVGLRPPQENEWIIDGKGNPMQWSYDGCGQWFVIISKIEQPAKYRRFANGADFMANKVQGIAVDWSSPSDCPGFYAIVAANNSFIWVAFGDVIQRFEWEQAFDKLKFRHADNSTSPFGVRIDEY
jgi:hypothetical protein